MGVGVGGVGVVDGASSSPGAARAGAAERGVHLTDRDVEELTSQLWDDAELGALLAPLLGPAGGGEEPWGWGRNPNPGRGNDVRGAVAARGEGADGGGTVGGGELGSILGWVEGDAFADPRACRGRTPRGFEAEEGNRAREEPRGSEWGRDLPPGRR